MLQRGAHSGRAGGDAVKSVCAYLHVQPDLSANSMLISDLVVCVCVCGLRAQQAKWTASS